MTWDDGPGVLELPDGRRVRGRGVRRGEPETAADWSVVLLGRRPAWADAWVRWPDFFVPLDWGARRVLVDAYERAASQRVEVACAGGRGRTGTALACLVTLADPGLGAAEAVAYVRCHYDHRAVEVPWQRLFVRWFAGRPAV